MSYQLPPSACKHSHGSHTKKTFCNAPKKNLSPSRLLISRRKLILSSAALFAIPSFGRANTVAEITWDSLIPDNASYPEIIGRGEVDIENDRWLPQFDANASKLNPSLDGTTVKLPGFLIPIDLTTAGVTSFILAPYAGACLHTPPPPPNQLIYVTTETPWPSFEPFEAVTVTGRMQHAIHSTDVAVTGYEMDADQIDVYLW